YKFPRHPKAQDVANAMVQKFKEHWARIAAGADAPDVNSVATLASLVERETPQPDERPLVAGVFENRLSRRIALQCDPTVIYALERTGQYKGALTSADLHVDSPQPTGERRAARATCDDGYPQDKESDDPGRGASDRRGAFHARRDRTVAPQTARRARPRRKDRLGLHRRGA